MVLHLLGKKSWNVYNSDNIARVRQDEATAKAREEEQERRMQEDDAERRMNILRGIPVDAPRAPVEEESTAPSRPSGGRERKRRRIAGEDDTDRDIRLAKENSALIPGTLQTARKSTSDAPLVDGSGHINLFPPEPSKRNVEKNPEAEAEAQKKKRENEDQYTMRFSNAAGFRQNLANPWYASSMAHDQGLEEQQSKNVWGNEDPGRKERAKMRLDSSDPFAIMQRGVKDLRKVEQEKQKWKEEKEREVEELIAQERRKRRQRDHKDDGDDVEDRSLTRIFKHGHDKERRSRHHKRSEDERSRSRNRRSYRHHYHHRHRSSR
ncbi:MAG: hypothetical protein M1834_009691 [Cirrosporium novae-zelandiae]|nr:MAG: hypothetical protein M1834_009691 [Cirrosporium novae-zelandiae]